MSRDDSILGRVHFTFLGEPATATLYRDGRWETPHPVLTEGQELLYSLRDYSPADGRLGAALLAAFAEECGGTVEMPPETPGSGGKVY